LEEDREGRNPPKSSLNFQEQLGKKKFQKRLRGRSHIEDKSRKIMRIVDLAHRAYGITKNGGTGGLDQSRGKKTIRTLLKQI